MGIALQIIVGILVLIAIAIFTIVRVKMSHHISRYDVTANMPLVSNPARTQFTDGYASGTLKRIKSNKNGTFLVEYYPDDIEQGEDIPRPPMQGVIVRKDFAIRLARGDYGDRRERIILVGRSPADYPDKLRDTSEGEWMTRKGQLAFLKSTFGKAIPSGDEALAEAMKSYSRVGIGKNALAEIKEANAQYRKMMQIPTESEEPKPPK